MNKQKKKIPLSNKIAIIVVLLSIGFLLGLIFYLPTYSKNKSIEEHTVENSLANPNYVFKALDTVLIANKDKAANTATITSSSKSPFWQNEKINSRYLESIHPTTYKEFVKSKYYIRQIYLDGFKINLAGRINSALQYHTYRMGLKYNVPYTLILGIMGAETGWDMDIGKVYNSSLGLSFEGPGMIWSGNLKELRRKIYVTDLSDPWQNIEAIAYIMQNFLYKTNNEQMALICYNCGEAGAMNYFKDFVFETQYSRRVIHIKNILDSAMLQQEFKD